ncbi:hypothetical protein NG726_24735 [Pseudomonas sp. MOB-449]|nr:hypothetical protein [Pseudomonas sp. MOB-449]
MNIARRRIPAALLTLTGLFAGAFAHKTIAQSVARRREIVVKVPIAGTLTTPTEDIRLKGEARINSSSFSDSELDEPPGVVLLIDLRSVEGIGAISQARYRTEGQSRFLRELRPTDLLELTFVLAPQKTDATSSVVSVRAIFELTFNVDQGQLLAATASFSTPEH